MKRPCIRGLSKFKNGCPERGWNGSEGCPAWKTLVVSSRGEPLKKEVKSQCISEWGFDFAWATLGLLEGNQQATERFRNAMCEPDPDDPLNDNKARPKPNSAIKALVGILQTVQKEQVTILQHEIKKQIAER